MKRLTEKFSPSIQGLTQRAALFGTLGLVATLASEAQAEPTVKECLEAYGTEICEDKCLADAKEKRANALNECEDSDQTCEDKAENAYAADMMRCEGAAPKCSNGIDDDKDGLIDAQDPGCWDKPGDKTSYNPNDNDESNLTACNDKKDNDGDGKVDINDPGCHTDGNPNNSKSYNPNDNSERDPKKPVCSDDEDNDGDGLKDKDDPGCHKDGDVTNEASYDPKGKSEWNSKNPACSDGLDNDKDGLVDINDPGCHEDGDVTNEFSYTPNKDNEWNGEGPKKPACSDGLDNDKDGLVDINDPGCHADGDVTNEFSYTPNKDNEWNGKERKAEPTSSPQFSAISEQLTEAQIEDAVKKATDPESSIDLTAGGFFQVVPGEGLRADNTTRMIGGGGMIGAGYSRRLSETIRVGGSLKFGVFGERADWNYVEGNNKPRPFVTLEAGAMAQFRPTKVLRPDVHGSLNVVRGIGGGGGAGLEVAIPNNGNGPELGIRLSTDLIHQDLGRGGERQGTNNTEVHGSDRLRGTHFRAMLELVLHLGRKDKKDEKK